MVQGYYTLQEAAKFLNMHVDELKQMAQKSQIRSFQDRGTLRFRIQDIQELARARGGSHDEQEPALGESRSPRPKSGAMLPSGSKKAPSSPKPPTKPTQVPEDDSDPDADSVDLGADLPAPASASKSKPSSKSKKSPTPTPGSDSDVRLISDGSDVSFSVPKDSDIKLADSDVKISGDPFKPKTGAHPQTPSSGSKRPSQVTLGSGAQSKSKLGGSSSARPATSPRPGGTPQPADSGVRLVPMDDDSDVKLHAAADVPLGEAPHQTASDSNVRLEKISLTPADSSEGSMQLTEEINLDEEILKHQQSEKDKPATKLKAKSALKLPTTSPFELSEADLDLPSSLQSGAPKTPVKSKDDSSDFDLTAQAPADKGSSDFDLVPTEDGNILVEQGDSNDFSLEASDEERVLEQDHPVGLTSSTSGISLDNPVDAGISLEEGSGEPSDFDLSLEVEDTPRPQPSKPIDDSDSGFDLSAQKTPSKPKKSKAAADSSEFELSIDSDAELPAGQKPDSDEFEVNLEGSGQAESGDADSEFELTLDDSGNVAAVEEEAAPQVKSKAKPKKPDAAEEQDIFDTDFEVPALDESDDAAVADSELESSDFDLALDDSELAQEEESGSQVVALDEEDSETVISEDSAVVDDVDVEEESSDFADLDADVQVEDEDIVDVEEETETAGRREIVVQEKLVPAAPWGVLPVLFMLPCVIIMFLVGILGYELVQTTAGLKPPGPLTKALTPESLQKR
jgi:hypothetical protein